MIITDIRIHTYSAAYKNPTRNGKYTYPATKIVIHEVVTDGGVNGVGWVHGSDVVIKTMLSLEDRAIGQDPFNVGRIWERMYLPKAYRGEGLTTRATSGIDIALWGIKGKVAGKSVCQMMGGYADRIPAYIAGGHYEEGEGWDMLQSEIKENPKRETKAVKMKMEGVSIKEDLERVNAVWDAVEPDIHLLVDADNAYDRIDALEMGRELEHGSIYWFEEPLSPDDIESCAKLQKKLDIPIAIGENGYIRWESKQLIEANAAQVLNADAQVLDDITEQKKVADLAMSSHVLPVPRGDQEVHTHLVASAPNGLIAEYYDNNINALLEDISPGPIRLNELGRIVAPQASGLGMKIKYERIHPYCTYSSDDK